MSVTTFFCYAREDETLLNKLKSHLRPLQRQGLIDMWYDREIGAGAEWEQEIKQHLDTAQIVLLLVSPDFMDSDYCYGVEMKRALERHRSGEASVIPIILRPVHWYVEPLSKLQVLPTGAIPVTDRKWCNLDEAFLDVTDEIYKVAQQWSAYHVPGSSVVSEATQQKVISTKGIASEQVAQGRYNVQVSESKGIVIGDHTHVEQNFVKE